MFSKTDIYPFEAPDGEARHLDPMAVRRSLLVGTNGYCWAWVRQAREYETALAGEADDDKRAEWASKQAELEGYLANAAMQAFGLEPVDPATGAGATEVFALGALYDFVRWLEAKKAPTGT